nr:MAG TPA: hypothetical protein [Caudoviricetes sp.]
MNPLEARRRLLGRNVYKRTTEGNPAIAQGSLDRMYPGITMQGWTEQASTTGAQLINQDETVIGGLSGNMGNEFDSTNRIRTGFIRVEPNTTYIISGLSGFNIANSFAYDSEKTMTRIGAVTTTTTTTTLENESYLRISFSKPDQSDFTEEELQKLRKTLMFNKGDVALPWEPYTGSHPSPSPDYPQEIVSAGKYNEDAQKWDYEITIANEQTDPDKNQTVTLTADRPLTKWDKLEKRNGQWGWVYSSAEIVFDGSEDESWSKRESDWSGSIFLTNISSFADGNDVKYQSMCEKLIPYEGGWDAMPLYHFQNVDHVIGIAMEESISTVETLRTWLSENPLTVLYQTAEETFVPLSQTEQEQMNALHTFRPTTVLSNDADCEMELTYKTKKSLEVTA